MKDKVCTRSRNNSISLPALVHSVGGMAYWHFAHSIVMWSLMPTNLSGMALVPSLTLEIRTGLTSCCLLVSYVHLSPQLLLILL